MRHYNLQSVIERLIGSELISDGIRTIDKIIVEIKYISGNRKQKQPKILNDQNITKMVNTSIRSQKYDLNGYSNY